MLNRNVLAVFVTIPVWLSATSGVRAALSQSDRELARTILTLRQTALGSVQEGRGSADLSERHVGLDGNTITREAKVEFAFVGKNSIYWMTHPKDLLESGMKVDDRLTFYFGAGPGPSAVSIQRNDLSHGGAPLQDERLQGWSFEDIARLPWNRSDDLEQDAFERLVSQKGASLIRKGNEVEFSCQIDGQASDHIMALFDLACGGMVRRYSRSLRIPQPDAGEIVITRDEHFIWNSVGDRFLPTSREVRTRQWRSGKVEVQGDSLISFSAIYVGVGSLDKIGVTQLRIPVGTPVIDHITGLEYRYGADTGRTTGGAPINGGDPLSTLLVSRASRHWNPLVLAVVVVCILLVMSAGARIVSRLRRKR